jgi:hypothetical protein
VTLSPVALSMSFRQARIQWLLISLYVRTLPDRIAGSFDESTISAIFALIVATGMFAKAREELERFDAYVNSFSSF